MSTTQSSYHAFVSYSRTRQLEVEQLCESLRRQGLEVWRDEAEIRTGAEWWLEIVNGLKHSLSAVLIVTPEWLDSQVCQDEFHLAMDEGKKLIPLVLGELPFEDLPTPLQKVHCLRISGLSSIPPGLLSDLVKEIRTDEEIAQALLGIIPLANDWDEANRSPDFSYFLRDQRLVQAEEILRRLTQDPDISPRLDETSRSFIAASVDAEERQRQHEIERRRQAARLVTNIIVDLRDDLEPIGNLSLISKADDSVASYFETLDMSDGELLGEERFLKMESLLRRVEALEIRSEYEAAYTLCHEAIAIGEQLLQEAEEPTWIDGQARAYTSLGQLEIDRLRYDYALERLEKALELNACLSDEMEWIAQRAEIHNGFGVTYTFLENWKKSYQHYQSALELRKKVCAEPGSKEKWRTNLIYDYANLAEIEFVHWNLSKARDLYETALEVGYRELRNHSQNTGAQLGICFVMERLGCLTLTQGKVSNGLRLLQEAITKSRELVRWDPENSYWYRVHTDISDRILEQLHNRQDHHLRIQLVRENLYLIDALSLREFGDPIWKLRKADVLNRLGMALIDLEGHEEARHHFESALNMARPFVRSGSRDPKWLLLSCLAQRNIGWSLLESATQEEEEKLPQTRRKAMEAFIEASGFCAELIERDPENAEWQKELAFTHSWIVQVAGQMGDDPRMRESYLVIEAHLDKFPSYPAWGRDIALSISSLAQYFPEAERTVMFETSQNFVENALKGDPDNSSRLLDVARVNGNISDSLEALGLIPDSIEHRNNALKIYENLYAREAENSDWPYLVAVARYVLARLYSKLPKDSAAEAMDKVHECYLEALQYSDLVSRYERPDYLHFQIQILMQLGLILNKVEGSVEDRTEYFRRAFQQNLALVTDYPGNPKFARSLVDTAIQFTETIRGNTVDRHKALSRAYNQLTRISVVEPADVNLSFSTAIIGAKLARESDRLGDQGAALALYKKSEAALHLLTTDSGEVDDDLDVRRMRNYLLVIYERAALESAFENFEAAEECYLRGSKGWQELLDNHLGDNLEGRRLKAIIQVKLGDVQRDLGKPAEAEASYLLGIEEMVELVTDDPGFRDQLGDTYHRLGELLDLSLDPERKTGAYLEAIKQWKAISSEASVPEGIALKIANAKWAIARIQLDLENEEAWNLFDEALASYRSHIEAKPLAFAERKTLWEGHRFVSNQLFAWNRISSALPHYQRMRFIAEESLDLLQDTEDVPAQRIWNEYKGISLQFLANFALHSGDEASAIECMNTSETLFRSLLRKDPHNQTAHVELQWIAENRPVPLS